MGKILRVRDIPELDEICVTKLNDYASPKIWRSYFRNFWGSFSEKKSITYCKQFKRDLKDLKN